MRLGNKTMRGVGAAIVLTAVLALGSGARAGEWLASKSGCQIWDPNPQLDETVTWSGGCTNGHADGQGTVQWVKDGQSIETDQGEWRDGKQAGKGIQNWPIGRYEGELSDGLPNGQGVLTFQKYRYEGQFRDGKPNGVGNLIQGNQIVGGIWKDGCLQDSQRKASIGVPLSACK